MTRAAHGVLAVLAVVLAGCTTEIPPSELRCAAIAIAAGPEDLAFAINPDGDPEFIIAASDRAPGFSGNGGIYTLPISDAGPGQASRLPVFTADGGKWPAANAFRPLGISVVADAAGSSTVFSINTADPPSIEIFRRIPAGLRHDATLTSPLLTTPNDLVAISADEFFVTNAASVRGPNAYRQWLLRRPTGTVLHYRAGRSAPWSIAATGLKFANGIAFAPERDQVFVSEFNARLIRAYQRDPVTSALTETPSLVTEVPAYPDNLTWMSPHYLYIAAHRSPVRSFCHVIGLCDTSPSRAFIARFPTATSPPVVAELGFNAADHINAASTIAPFRDWTYVAQLVRPEVFACRRANAATETAVHSSP